MQTAAAQGTMQYKLHDQNSTVYLMTYDIPLFAEGKHGSTCISTKMVLKMINY